jgi:hypothetical protein
MEIRKIVLGAGLSIAVGLGCSTAPQLREPRPLSRELADQINVEASGRTMEVDISGHGWRETLRTRHLELTSPDGIGLVPEQPNERWRIVSNCQVQTVRVPGGSNAGRGVLIGGAIALSFLAAIAVQSPAPYSDVSPAVIAAVISPVVLGMAMGTGALVGWGIPKGPVVHPISPPAPGEVCR